MDELLNQITQRTGLPPDKARQVLQVVADFLHDKLPAPLASQLNQFLGSQNTASAANPQAAQQSGGNMVDQGKSFLGGLFGSKGGDQPTQP